MAPVRGGRRRNLSGVEVAEQVAPGIAEVEPRRVGAAVAGGTRSAAQEERIPLGADRLGLRRRHLQPAHRSAPAARQACGVPTLTAP